MKAVIVNQMGLHARPAAMLVKMASAYECEIFFGNGAMEVNGKSIMGVLTLAAECGAELTVRAEGSDSDTAVDALVELISGGFGES